MEMTSREYIGTFNGMAVVATGHIQNRFADRGLGIPNILAALHCGETFQHVSEDGDDQTSYVLEDLRLVTSVHGDELVLVSTWFEGTDLNKTICRKHGKPVFLTATARKAMDRNDIPVDWVKKTVDVGDASFVQGYNGEEYYVFDDGRTKVVLADNFHKDGFVVTKVSGTGRRKAKPARRSGYGTRKQARRQACLDGHPVN